ncbi:MAG: MBL fold metallo-hydrolase [Clostridia bacterium]
MLQIKTYGGNKIGGCITEISSKKTKIIIDYGTNLDNSEQIDIEGLTNGRKKYDAVFISHYHLDHIGEIKRIKKTIPIYVEKTTKKIYDVMCDFSSKSRIDVKTFEFKEEIIVGDLVVKAYRVDHSAYNSAMFFISDGEETALYTGDFRDNGYTGDKVLQTIAKIGQVDYLIIEGTNIGNMSHILKKEESLVNDFVDICNKYNQVFVMMSSSNIDRITTLLKACNKTKHILIQDIYMAHITSIIQNEDKKNIPNPVKFDNVMVYKPKYLKNKKNQEFKDKYINKFNEKNSNSILYKPFVMNVRNSMLNDLKTFHYKGNILTNACLVYSMWSGYKQKKEIKEFLDNVNNLGITIIEKDIHTTGHASEELIQKVKEMVNAKQIFTIHTESKVC